MKDLYLLNYNNYANRIVKKFDNLEDYFPYLIGDVAQNINFNPGNGLQTVQLLNSRYAAEGTPDYLVVADANTYDIESRWFVISATRTRGGQYNLVLKRDSVADALDKVLSADSFISRGHVEPSNPLILNSEGLQFNQIKQEEILLKDRTEVPWIVGYISPDVAADHTDGITGDIEGYYDAEYTSLSDYPFYNYSTQISIDIDTIYAEGNVFNKFVKTIKLYKNGKAEDADAVGISPTDLPSTNESLATYNALNNWRNLTNVERYPIVENIEHVSTNSDLEEILNNEVNKILKVGTTLYKVTVEKVEDATIQENITIGSEKDRLINAQFTDFIQYNSDIEYFGQKFLANQLKIKGTTYKIVFEIVNGVSSSKEFTFNVSQTNLSNTETPYGIICMPYSDEYNVLSKSGESEDQTLAKENRIKIMQALGTVSNLLYDIQILPYCPIKNLIINKSSGEITTSNQETIDITETTSESYVTSMIVAKTPSFSFSITKAITIDNVKKANETEMWRLNSPNYATSFEFNPAKFYEGDKTVIRKFNVDCTYRPYTPYIHVAPEFSGIYGKNFNDSRGLICGGDFSIDRISDTWETYQYNNKNYQLQFDRQIQSLELKQGWSEASAVIGGVTGAAGGAAMGAIAGGPVGAAIGAGAGLLDAGFNTAETVTTGRDAIAAAKDQQRWSLGNIQAQPYGLTKVGALNANNKMFPFLEHYSCTDEEKDVLDKYLEYNGMTIMRLGKITDYLDNSVERSYIKANIVRFSNEIKENYQFVSDIQGELNKGVYIQ